MIDRKMRERIQKRNKERYRQKVGLIDPLFPTRFFFLQSYHIPIAFEPTNESSHSLQSTLHDPITPGNILVDIKIQRGILVFFPVLFNPESPQSRLTVI